ncbi:DUF4381 domain-containing protein [Luteimonas sp. SX5]|uniref:DUF4381 domain-containing protein n=1 Tax=Luteimonas galliterrae TaxID=2940486 RepID=A0ABT0MKK8_9GAMM|nr:DUF4381 domain-containing protein [Luteimonas galliterrae]MCL1635415.1 DUF4381 domain-containing protein [Luteimonas galliterrae]
MSPDALVLRDIHQPPAPAWWPPAPGWWLLAAIVLALIVLAYAWMARRRRRQRAIVALFDKTLEQAQAPAARVAAISELLRRASRRRDPAADRLQGEDWLRFLDGDGGSAEFSAGAGRLLLDGGYRRDVDAAQLAALRPLARRRYLQLMAVRR